jgi:hypothetical protein
MHAKLSPTMKPQRKKLHNFQHQSNLKPPFIIEIKHQKRNVIPRTN